MQINLVYCNRSADTKSRIVEVVRNSFPQHTLRCINSGTATVPLNLDASNTIFYGDKDDWDMTKPQFLEFVADLIPNTMVNREDLDDYDSVVTKRNSVTTISLNKDAGNSQRYRFVHPKQEWRVNYSYGVVNQVLNKNLTNSQIFGKVGNNSHWSVEQDSETRGYLTRLTKQIGERVAQRFPKVRHFGLDIIKDTITNQFYMLELNRANSRNEENCKWLIEHFLNHHERSSFEPIRNSFVSRMTAARSMEEVRAIAREMVGVSN